MRSQTNKHKTSRKKHEIENVFCILIPNTPFGASIHEKKDVPSILIKCDVNC